MHGSGFMQGSHWISHIKLMMEEKRQHHRLLVIENKEPRILIPNQVDAALGSASRVCLDTATRQRSSQNDPLKR
jgi:hypothetical protein